MNAFDSIVQITEPTKSIFDFQLLWLIFVCLACGVASFYVIYDSCFSNEAVRVSNAKKGINTSSTPTTSVKGANEWLPQAEKNEAAGGAPPAVLKPAAEKRRTSRRLEKDAIGAVSAEEASASGSERRGGARKSKK